MSVEFFKKNTFICLAAPGLCCGTQDLLVVAHDSDSSCSVWNYVPCPGIKPRPLALGPWSLSHWATSRVPPSHLCGLQSQLPCSCSLAPRGGLIGPLQAYMCGLHLTWEISVWVSCKSLQTSFSFNPTSILFRLYSTAVVLSELKLQTV